MGFDVRVVVDVMAVFTSWSTTLGMRSYARMKVSVPTGGSSVSNDMKTTFALFVYKRVS